jgi:hypothetical protein
MDTATSNRPAPPELDAVATTVSWATRCLNCGSALAGPFCPECGQRAVPAHPTLRELFGEAFAEFSGWDGKLAETIKTLVRKPGQLTLEFLAGRRARFISPLRLYLTASLVYFLLAASTPGGNGLHIGLRPPAGGVAVQSKTDQTGLTEEDRAEALKALEAAPKWLRPLVQRVADNPKQLQADVLQAMPKGLFALLPVFALLLALFYRGRRFADHLYFAIHVHAFVFIAFILTELTKLTHVAALSIVGSTIVLLWLPIYGHLALRRVYGGSPAMTLLKETGIGLLYAAASVPMWFLLALWVAGRGA